MKTTEQKAQRYDEAIEELRGMMPNWENLSYNGKTFLQDLVHIIPELKESEDDRIRKEIVRFIRMEVEDEIVGNKWIAWLGKQGEQKSTDKVKPKFNVGDAIRLKNSNTTGFIIESISDGKYYCKGCSLDIIGCDRDYELVDKVEPKFHEGDWVVWDNKISCHVDNIYQGKESLMYTITDINNMIRSYSAKSFDNNAHLWTIQDAKDGDVLSYKDEISLYKHDIKNCTKQETTFGGFVYYCCYDGKRFIMDSLYSLTEQDKTDIHPATKEQRDTLEKAMADAGWEFDFEKMKKIEQKPAEWSEDDEKMLDNVKPKFKFGDRVRNKKSGLEQTLGSCIEDVYEGTFPFRIKDQDDWELVEQKPAENSGKPSENVIEKEDMTEYNKGFECGKQRVLKYPEDFGLCKNSVWSEEDKDYYDAIIAKLEVTQDDAALTDNQMNFLKSLRPQNNITDEELVQARNNAYNDALDKIEYHSGEPTFNDGWSAAIWYLKKRNTMPQSQWKPSEEQMSAKKFKLWASHDKGDSSHTIWLYAEKPTLNTTIDGYWSSLKNMRGCVDESFIPELIFENSPKEIEIAIKVK